MSSNEPNIEIIEHLLIFHYIGSYWYSKDWILLIFINLENEN